MWHCNSTQDSPIALNMLANIEGPSYPHTRSLAHTYTRTYTHTLALSATHRHIHTHALSLAHAHLSLCLSPSLCLSVSLSLSHTLTHAHTHRICVHHRCIRQHKSMNGRCVASDNAAPAELVGCCAVYLDLHHPLNLQTETHGLRHSVCQGATSDASTHPASSDCPLKTCHETAAAANRFQKDLTS